MRFRDFFNMQEGSQGATQQLTRRFADLGDVVQSSPSVPTWKNTRQAKNNLWQAYQRAQQINKNNQGHTPIYHALSEPKQYSLKQMLGFLHSRTKQEISVSVKKGTWHSTLVLEGIGKLLLYYDKDVWNIYSAKKQMLPIAPLAPEESHYDEGIVRLSDVKWTKLHIDFADSDINNFGNIQEITSLAKQFGLQVVNSQSNTSSSVIGQTNLWQKTHGKLRKNY